MSDNRITDAEWEVMEVLWAEGASPSAKIVRLVTTRKSWAQNTVLTLLRRLVQKGFVTMVKEDGRFHYEATVTRCQYVAQEGKTFLQRMFGGESAPLLMHFAKDANLSAADAEELRKILKGKSTGKK